MKNGTPEIPPLSCGFLPGGNKQVAAGSGGQVTDNRGLDVNFRHPHNTTPFTAWIRRRLHRNQVVKADVLASVAKSSRFLVANHVVPGGLPVSIGVLGGQDGKQGHAGLVTP